MTLDGAVIFSGWRMYLEKMSEAVSRKVLGRLRSYFQVGLEMVISTNPESMDQIGPVTFEIRPYTHHNHGVG